MQDDVPTTIAPNLAMLLNAVGATFTGFLDTPDGNIDNNVGADQPGTISFANIIPGENLTGVVNGSNAVISFDGNPVQLFLTDAHHLQGWTGGLNTGTKIFEITLLPDGSLSTSNDQYKVDIFHAMGAFETTTVNNFSALGQNNQQFKALNVPDTTEDLLFSGYHQFADGSTNDTTGNSVSASTNGVGVLNNSMDDGDTLRIDFVNNVTVAGWQQQHLQLCDTRWALRHPKLPVRHCPGEW